MTPGLILSVILGYFLLLILISWFTGRNNDNETFFTGNRQSPWYVVAFGMIGASLSGVTFISVPGWVEASQFSYLQMVLGYLLGYLVIARVLLPLYYRLELTSIYSYLDGRFGPATYQTGAWFFLLSRVIGASFRLYLVATVLQFAVFGSWGVPFWVTVVTTIVFIWIYTFRGGIKTIVYTDTLQTLFMLLAVCLTIYLISPYVLEQGENWVSHIRASELSRIWFFDDPADPKFFLRQFLSGMFITITMTGLDQDMMQKNLTCRNLGDAQKNMLWFSVVLVFVNFLFLGLGLFLQDYADARSIQEAGDKLYPAIALGGDLPMVVAVFFLIGLIAAAYSSADSALTALTTSFCVDILRIKDKTKEAGKRIRNRVHIGFSLVLILVIIVFGEFASETVIRDLFKAAGFTYGPLLGLYAFGLFTKWRIKDQWVPLVAIASPLICFIIDQNSMEWWGFKVGFEILIVNGLLTFIGLLFLMNRKADQNPIS